MTWNGPADLSAKPETGRRQQKYPSYFITMFVDFLSQQNFNVLYSYTLNITPLFHSHTNCTPQILSTASWVVLFIAPCPPLWCHCLFCAVLSPAKPQVFLVFRESILRSRRLLWVLLISYCFTDYVTNFSTCL